MKPARQEVGQGSVFCFTARLGLSQTATAATPMPAPVVAPVKRDFGQARVLLVDDSPTNLLVAKAYLSRLGLEVETADNGQSAVDKATRSAFAAILMDLQMPGMDGFAATRAIRASGNHTPIIALTAAAMDKDRQAAEEAGMDDHIAKPIDPMELAAVLGQWIPEQPQAAPAPAPASVDPILPVAAIEPASGSGPLDLEQAAEALGGDQELLLQVLQRFHQDFVQAPEQLREALGQQQLDVAIRLVHTLKGLAPTLGAGTLHQLAVRFEQGLQQQDSGLQAEFVQELNRVLAAIEAAKDTNGSAARQD